MAFLFRRSRQGFLLLARPPATCERAVLQAQPVLRVHFSSSSRLFQQAAPRAAKGAPKPSTPKLLKNAPAKPTPTPTPTPVVNPGAARTAVRPPSYAEQLALKGRTLLYEAPSHFWYRVSSYASGAFCISYTVYQYWDIYLSPHEGLSWWIPHAMGLVCVFMASMGAYFIMGTGRIVRSIEAVPAASVTNKLAAIAKQHAGQETSPIYIEVAMRRIVPFLPSRKTVLPPHEVQLPFRMYGVFGMLGHDAAAQRPLSMVERVRAERAAREAKALARKETMDHILTAPFRDAAKAFRGAWDGVVRSFNREGFAKIRLGNQTYKIDVSGGWALDQGRALDRLLPIRPNALKD